MTQQGTGIAIGGPFDGTEFPLEPATVYQFKDDTKPKLDSVYVQTGETDDEGRLIYRPAP